MARAKCPVVTPPMYPILLGRIVATLLPQHQGRTTHRHKWHSTNPGRRATGCLCRVTDNKGRCPGSLPNLSPKLAIKMGPDLSVGLCNGCLHDGEFPAAWKQQNLALLPSRPICLLDTIGKVLERIIYDPMAAYSEGTRGLSTDQYGFQKERSTIDSNNGVVDKAQKAG